MLKVDSVSAIIAQIPDLFLAYSACVFAMLGRAHRVLGSLPGLRATFFAVDELVKLFTLLSGTPKREADRELILRPYAVSVILIFIGTKLVGKPREDFVRLLMSKSSLV